MNDNDYDASTAMRVLPDYESGYWLSNKANNLILKKIICFLTSYSVDEERVTPFLDDQKHVHLMVQRGNQEEEIVFGDGFPNEAPKIEVTGGFEVIKIAEWQYNGDIYDAFVRYYDDCFKKKTETTTLVYNLETGEFESAGTELAIPSSVIAVTDMTTHGHGPLFISEFINADSVTEAVVFKNDLDEFINSPETIAFGDIPNEDWTYNHMIEDFNLTGVTLKMLSIAVPTLKYSVVFYKGEENNYQPNTFVVEDIQTGLPKAFYVDLEGVKREIKVRVVELLTKDDTSSPKDTVVWANVYKYDLEDFINSSEMVIRGSSWRSSIRERFYDKTQNMCFFGYCYYLFTKPFADSCKNNVLFFKEKANDYPPNSIVVECVLTKHPKAFYVEDDGVKKDLEIKIEQPLDADVNWTHRWDSFDAIHLFRDQIEEIKVSPKSVILGYPRLGSDGKGTSAIGVVLEDPATFMCSGLYTTTVFLHKGAADDYKLNSIVVEDVLSEQPKAFFVKTDGTKKEFQVFLRDSWESVIVYQYEIDEFLNSSQVVVAGSIDPDPWRGSFCAENPEEDSRFPFVNGYLLRTRQSTDSTKDNVLFFREKAIDYPSNTYVVENLQTRHPKAFYVEADGSIKEKKIYINIIEVNLSRLID